MSGCLSIFLSECISVYVSVCECIFRSVHAHVRECVLAWMRVILICVCVFIIAYVNVTFQLRNDYKQYLVNLI